IDPRLPLETRNKMQQEQVSKAAVWQTEIKVKKARENDFKETQQLMRAKLEKELEDQMKRTSEQNEKNPLDNAKDLEAARLEKRKEEIRKKLMQETRVKELGLAAAAEDNLNTTAGTLTRVITLYMKPPAGVTGSSSGLSNLTPAAAIQEMLSGETGGKFYSSMSQAMA
ncbi:unnamed protein product, partial [Amoebophrya sp. A25]